MIEVYKGSVIDADCKYIGHLCNNRGTMGPVVAKLIREAYPKAYEEYRKAYKESGNNILGMCQVVKIDDNKSIVNIIAQDGYADSWKPVAIDYSLFDLIIKDLAERMAKENEELALPYFIGAGRAGGDSKKIQHILRSHFDKSYLCNGKYVEPVLKLYDI